MLKSVLSVVTCAIFVTGCQTYPSVPPQTQVRLPALDKLPQDVLDQSFTETLQKRLSTRQSGPTQYELRSKPAIGLTTQRDQQLGATKSDSPIN